MFGRSTWCRTLALDPPESKHYVCCDHRQKENDGVTSGNVREHAVAQVGDGRLHENIFPRHWRATCMLLITVRSHNVCRT